MVLRGKWAQGIEPRNFTWILQDRLAVCERPGGYGQNHRKVRRQEEIIWLREQGFTEIVSLCLSPHNLHNYDEMGMPWRHRPFRPTGDQERYLRQLFPELRHLLVQGGKILVHQEELSDRMAGLMAAYILWNRLVPGGPQAVSVIEQLLHKSLGPSARQLVGIVPRLPTPEEAPLLVPEPPTDTPDDDVKGDDGADGDRG